MGALDIIENKMNEAEDAEIYLLLLHAFRYIENDYILNGNPCVSGPPGIIYANEVIKK